MALPSSPQWGRRLSSKGNGKSRTWELPPSLHSYPLHQVGPHPYSVYQGLPHSFVLVPQIQSCFFFLWFFQVGCVGRSQGLRLVSVLSGGRSLTCNLTQSRHGPMPCSSASFLMAAFTLYPRYPRPSHFSKPSCLPSPMHCLFWLLPLPVIIGNLRPQPAGKFIAKQLHCWNPDKSSLVNGSENMGEVWTTKCMGLHVVGLQR